MQIHEGVPTPTRAEAKLLSWVKAVVLPLHGIPLWLRGGLTTAVVGLCFIAQLWFGGRIGGYPLLFAYPAVLLPGLVLQGGSGIFAVLLTLLVWFPFVSHTHDARQYAGMGMFAVFGLLLALALEALHLATGMLVRREVQLTDALEEVAAQHRRKDLLFSELGHRVRNDLTAVIGMLRLRARQPETDASTALNAAADKISVVSRVYLHLSNGGEDLAVGARAFLDELVADIELARTATSPIRVKLGECENFCLESAEATAIGLIVNELVTNAFKYAFPNADRAGLILVALRKDGEEAVLTVEDNGAGEMAKPGGTGLGTRLVERLARQLRGRFERRFSPGEGARCEVRFPAPPTAGPS